MAAERSGRRCGCPVGVHAPRWIPQAVHGGEEEGRSPPRKSKRRPSVASRWRSSMRSFGTRRTARRGRPSRPAPCGQTFRSQAARSVHGWVTPTTRPRAGSPGPDALKSAVGIVGHKALAAEVRKLYHGVARVGDRLYLDLCRDGGECVEVDPSGWEGCVGSTDQVRSQPEHGTGSDSHEAMVPSSRSVSSWLPATSSAWRSCSCWTPSRAAARTSRWP